MTRRIGHIHKTACNLMLPVPVNQALTEIAALHKMTRSAVVEQLITEAAYIAKLLAVPPSA